MSAQQLWLCVIINQGSYRSGKTGKSQGICVHEMSFDRWRHSATACVSDCDRPRAVLSLEQGLTVLLCLWLVAGVVEQIREQLARHSGGSTVTVRCWHCGQCWQAAWRQSSSLSTRNNAYKLHTASGLIIRKPLSVSRGCIKCWPVLKTWVPAVLKLQRCPEIWNSPEISVI